MPLRPSSAALTDAYRRAMVALRERGVRAAKQYWNAIDPDEIDATYQVVQLALEVSALQREGARLSSGYLLAFIEAERRERLTNPPVVSALAVGRSFSGMPLEEALRGPVLSTKVMIRDTGRPARECLNVFAAELEKQVSLAIDNATRDSLRSGIDASEYCDGWVRAVRGTCAACAGAAEASKAPPGTPLQIHPNCQCVSEPSVKRREPTWMKQGQRNFDQNFRDFGDYRNDVGRNALHRFDEQHGYEFMQKAMRDPDNLFDFVKSKIKYELDHPIAPDPGDVIPPTHGYIESWGRFGTGPLTDAEVEKICAEVFEKVKWLEWKIAQQGVDLTGAGDPFYRALSMEHLPKSVLDKLDDGAQVTLSEPGFFATTPDVRFAQRVAAQTNKEEAKIVIWEVEGGKALPSAFVQQGEFIHAPGTRFTIKKISDGRYKVVIRNG